MFEVESFSEDDLRQNRKKAEELASNYSIADYYAYRKKAKTDLFFLCYSVLGYDKLARLHFDLSKWHREHISSQYREILLPRSHYKSTIMTIGDAIQIALPDDSNSEATPRNLGPDVRILLLHELADSAQLFLAEITQHFLTNPMLMGLFPECVPDLKKCKVNKSELELPRQRKWKETTFSTLGTGGRAQGRHFNFIKADDLIGDKARDSKLEMEAAKLWVDNIQSLLITPKEDHIDFIGTRWAFDDLYSHIEKAYGSRLVKYVRGIEEKQADGTKKLIFPEQFSFEAIEILRKNKKVFAAQYANDPRESASEFQEDWKRFYRTRPKVGGGFIIELGEKDSPTYRELDPFLDLDRVVLWDPAMSGLAGILVTGMDKEDNIIILEANKKDWTPQDAMAFVFMLVMKWQPRIVGIEHVLFSALFSLLLTKEMSNRGVRFMTQGLKTFGKAKDFRVRGLGHFFSAGKIWFHESMHDLIEEYDNFGATDNYHMLDALAHGPQIWRKPMPQMNNNLALPSGQDRISGYSAIFEEDEITYEGDDNALEGWSSR